MKRYYDLNAWRLFLRIAETGSVSEVAAQEAMEISTVSRTIEALEKSVGQNLFVPKSRPKKLTHAGQIAAQKVRELISSHEDFIKELQEETSELKGQITVSVSAGYAVVELPEFISAFNALYPDVTFQVETGMTVNDVKNRKCDLAGFTGPLLHDKGIIQIPRTYNYYLPLASPKYIAKHGMPLQPEDLVNHTIFRYNGPTREETRELIKDGKIVRIKGKTEINVTAALSILRATLDGYGVTLEAPIGQCYKEILSGQLVPILPGWYRKPLLLSTLVNTASWKLKRVRLFAQWLNDGAKEHMENIVQEVRSFYRAHYDIELPALSVHERQIVAIAKKSG